MFCPVTLTPVGVACLLANQHTHALFTHTHTDTLKTHTQFWRYTRSVQKEEIGVARESFEYEKHFDRDQNRRSETEQEDDLNNHTN